MDYHQEVRSAHQVACDLGKSLRCSDADLLLLRQGILPAASWNLLLGKVLQPLVKSGILTLAPLLAAAFLASSSHHCSLSEGLPIVISEIRHMGDLVETEGWFRTILYAATGLALLGFGIYYATRIPLDLLADVLAKRVRSVEGRVTAREEERKVRGKRDEVTYYLFEMKEGAFSVSRATFLALDSGGPYRVYYLPRSRTLVGIEPSALAREADERTTARSAA